MGGLGYGRSRLQESRLWGSRLRESRLWESRLWESRLCPSTIKLEYQQRVLGERCMVVGLGP